MTIKIIIKRLLLNKIGILKDFLDTFINLRRFQYGEYIENQRIRKSYIYCVAHFVIYGQFEIKTGDRRRLGFYYKGRNCDFIEEYYLRANPDVSQLLNEKKISSAAIHFIRSGFKEILEGKRTLYPDYVSTKILRSVEFSSEKKGKHLCFFAHYDPDGIIDDYVIYYLKSLREIECDIVFISASVKESELEKISSLCIKFLERGEYGRDFGSWYLALKFANINMSHYEFVIWANDSIYFPIRPIDNLLPFIRSKNLDYWGLTDSLEGTSLNFFYHIQSYFIGFSKNARELLFPIFISEYEKFPFLSKKGQISLFEFGLSQHALSKNLLVGSLCNIEDIWEVARNYQNLPPISDTNPTHFLWDTLITKFNCPVLKISILKEKFISPILAKSIIGKYYDFNLINNHLERITRKKQSYYLLSRASSDEVKLKHRIKVSPLSGGGKLCFFAHYDKNGQIHEYVLTCLYSLKKLGFEIIFITSSSNNSELKKLNHVVNEIIIKNESGRDFGSWWLGIKEYDYSQFKYDSFLLMNDSIYFPVVDPYKMFTEMDSYDFWGIVESFQTRWHIMSYFWFFKKECFKKFKEFFLKDFSSKSTKWEQIRNYEMRYPELLQSLGFKVGAFISCKNVAELVQNSIPSHPYAKSSQNLLFNMNHEFWDIIIEKFSCPSLKIELVRDNPLGIKTLKNLRKFISEKTSYDINIIDLHQKFSNISQDENLLPRFEK